MNKPDGIELALYACLRYEEAVLRSLPNKDIKHRWDIDNNDKEAILKWMTNRQKDIKDRT
jgi:hypothetical protein